MKKQQIHPAHKMKEILDQQVFVLKGYIHTTRNVLPKCADKIEHDYYEFLQHNSGIANNPKFRNLIPGWIVIGFILWQYAIDLTVLNNIYSVILEATFLRGLVAKLLIILCPLLLMALYLVISHFYSESKQRYSVEKAEKLQSRNIILEPYPKQVKKPGGLIIAGIAKMVVALFILISALAVVGASKGDPSTQTGILAITWLAFITHLIFIFFGEFILAAIYAFRARRFWKKRNKLEMEKVNTEGQIAIMGEQWLDQRQIANHQFPELSDLFRDKVTVAEQKVLNRLLSVQFVGVPVEEDRPLFLHWDPPFTKGKGSTNDKDNDGSMPKDNLILPAPPDYNMLPAPSDNGSGENPYVDNINSVQP